jgi:WD40 repeat protein
MIDIMSKQPKPDDAVQSPQNTPQAGLILGGIAGLKQQISADNLQLQIAALDALPNHGDAGLELLIQSLKSTSEVIRCNAYKLLKLNPDPQVQSALTLVNPYTLFQCVRTINRSDDKFCVIPASESTIGQYPQGRIASIKKFGIQVWDLESGSTIHQLKGYTSYVIDLAITPDTQQLISASKDKTIRIWNLESGELVRVLSGHVQQVNSVVVSPDGQYLFSGSRDQTIKIWNLHTGAEIKTLSGKSSAIFKLALSPDGKMIVSATQRNTIKVWDWQAEKLLHTLSSGSTGFIKIVIHPDGHLYSYDGSNRIWVWNLDTGKLLSTIQVYPDVDPEIFKCEDGTEIRLPRHPIAVTALAIAPEGQTLIIGGMDRSIKIWEISTNEEITRYQVPADQFVEQIVPTQDGLGMYSIYVDRSSRNPANVFHVWQFQPQ